MLLPLGYPMMNASCGKAVIALTGTGERCACMVRAKQERWVWLYCLLVAAVILTVCSKSSFLYPINDWTDANAYLTSGRGMLAGRVMYRDIYEHKGPLLYMLHALCCLVQSGGFFGVYLLEVVAGAWFLYAAYQLLVLYGVKRSAKVALPLIGAAVWASFSFQQGDSAEEISLPMLAWSLLSILRWLRAPDIQRMRGGELLLNGALIGCVLWLKFTLLGLYVPWVFGVMGVTFKRRGWRDTLSAIGWLALGVLLATLPWLLYFGLNGALTDWLKTYIYDNLFLYQDEAVVGWGSRLRAMAAAGADWWVRNPFYSAPLTVGLVWVTMDRLYNNTKRDKSKTVATLPANGSIDGIGSDHTPTPLEKTANPAADHQLPIRCGLLPITRRELVFWWMAALWMALGVFIGGKAYVYYGLVLAALLPLGAAPLCVMAKALWIKSKATFRTQRAAREGTQTNQPNQLTANATHNAQEPLQVKQNNAGSCIRRALLPAAALLLAIVFSLLTSWNVRDLGKARAETMQYRFAAVIAQTPNATLLNYNFMDAGFYTACDIAPTVKYFHRTNVHLPEMVEEQARYVAQGLTDYVVTRDVLPANVAAHYELIDTARTPSDYWYPQVYLYRLRN